MDADLRELERTWRASGAVAHEARLLGARRRSGLVTQDRLELAAYFGHPAARRALGPAAPAGDHPPLWRWARGLDPQGRAAFARAALADVDVARAQRADHRVDGAVARLLAWVGCPCDAHALGLLPTPQFSDALQEVVNQDVDDARELGRVRPALAAARLADSEDVAYWIHLVRRLVVADAARRAPLAAWALGADHDRPVVAAQDLIAAEVTYLRHRLERGELTRDDLRCAALAGHQAAARIVGPASPPSDLEDLLRRLLERDAAAAWPTAVGALVPLQADAVVSPLPDAPRADEGLELLRPIFEAVVEVSGRTRPRPGPARAQLLEERLGPLRPRLAAFRDRVGGADPAHWHGALGALATVLDPTQDAEAWLAALARLAPFPVEGVLARATAWVVAQALGHGDEPPDQPWWL